MVDVCDAPPALTVTEAGAKAIGFAGGLFHPFWLPLTLALKLNVRAAQPTGSLLVTVTV